MKNIITMLIMTLMVSITKAQYTSVNGSSSLVGDTVLCMESQPGGDLYFGTSGTGNDAKFSKVDNSNTIQTFTGFTGGGGRIDAMGLYDNYIAFYRKGNSGMCYYNGTNVYMQANQLNGALSQKINSIRRINSSISIVGGDYTYYNGGNNLAPMYDISYGSSINQYLSSLGANFSATSICHDMTKNVTDTIYAGGLFNGSFGTANIMKFIGLNAPTALYTATGIVTEIEMYHDSLFFIVGANVYRLAKSGGTATWINTIPGVNDLEVHDGKLFFGGSTLTSYDGTWTTLISVIDGSILTLASHNGSLYFGGDFSSIDNNTNYSKLCRFDISTSVPDKIQPADEHVAIFGNQFKTDTKWNLYDLSGRLIMNGKSGTYIIPMGVHIIQTDFGVTKVIAVE